MPKRRRPLNELTQLEIGPLWLARQSAGWLGDGFETIVSGPSASPCEGDNLVCSSLLDRSRESRRRLNLPSWWHAGTCIRQGVCACECVQQSVSSWSVHCLCVRGVLPLWAQLVVSCFQTTATCARRLIAQHLAHSALVLLLLPCAGAVHRMDEEARKVINLESFGALELWRARTHTHNSTTFG